MVTSKCQIIDLGTSVICDLLHHFQQYFIPLNWSQVQCICICIDVRIYIYYILIFIPVSCFLCVYKYTKMWLYMNITYDSYDIQNFSQSPCRLNCHFHCSPKSNSIDLSHVVPTKFAEALGEKRGLLEDHWIQINRMEFCWEIAWDSSFLCKNAAVNLKLTLPAFLELPSITS